MANFAYKLTTTKNMKTAGILDASAMTIDIDGEVKKLSTLWSEYDGVGVEINIKVKTEEELNEPEDSEEE